MKRLLITILLSVFVFSVNAEQHIYETTISELKEKEITENICIQNNSSFVLTNIECRFSVNGKTHSMQNIRKIPIGEDSEFEGYEDDEIDDELPYYLGEDAKFTRKNKNKISFELFFHSHNDDVTIANILNRDDSLYFIIEDKDGNVSPEEKIKQEGGSIVEIDGIKYLLFNGSAYKVNDR